jgi:hypothetical protein
MLALHNHWVGDARGQELGEISRFLVLLVTPLPHDAGAPNRFDEYVYCGSRN